MWNSSKPVLLVLTLVAIAGGAAWAVFGAAERYFLRELGSQNESTLQLVSAGLDGALRRYDPLPVLIADKDHVKQLLSAPPATDEVDVVNRELKEIAGRIGASDIYIMDASGLTVAASNFDTPTSFLGRNFAFRPYFTEAIAGRPNLYFAFGITSLKRGFYFSAPVRVSGAIAGAVALKIEVDALEESWRGVANKVFVADRLGVVFMASEPDWLFKSVSPLNDAQRREINESRQYPPGHLAALPITAGATGIAGAELWTMGTGKTAETFLAGFREIPDTGWGLHVLAPTATVTGSAVTVTAVVLMALLLAGLIAGIILQRRRRLMVDIERQRRGREELERRVEERTRDLNDANQRLTDEVKERTNAEEQLRSAQRELIQAGKLAALGQMSAALSHELNQPLAAIKTYAENARAYLKLDKVEPAGDNIGRISELADRMAELGKHLRNFARKPKQKIDVVDLAEVYGAVSQIMSARLHETGAELKIETLPHPALVMGGSVRLQQVLINLINNALDAMSGKKHQRVEIATAWADDGVSISVRDHGPGIEDAAIDQIFDPFFTTKDVNEGLGLGLSISYNIVQDFGGRLQATNHPDGGAVFTILLKNAESVRSAAE